MDREKVIKILTLFREEWDRHSKTSNAKALDMAIEALYKLQHYEDLEEQGRLIELPCKIGDTVYGSFQCYDGIKINECKVTGIRACKLKANSECYYIVDVEFNIIDPYYNDGRLMFFKRQAVIGNNYGSWERVFFTKEEVEAALKGAEQ